MKARVTTLDIVTLILELREKLVGLRFDQLYDVDKKTYLIRLTKTQTKVVLLIESGARFHTTSFEWPKNAAPSGFTMKLRKHLSNKRLESITQVGADRVIDFQFGTEAFAVHLLLELYDKGNIILTDPDYNILSLVRPHIQGEDRLVAHETYTVEKAKQTFSLSHAEMMALIEENQGKSIREIFLPKIEFGPGLFTHVLKKVGYSLQTKIPGSDVEDQFKEFGRKLFEALEDGRQILESPELLERGGFIVIQQQQKQPQQPQKTKPGQEPVKVKGPAVAENLVIYDQYNPAILATDFPAASIVRFPGLDETLDEFYSKLEAQKVDMKTLNQEREAYKKLARVKDDQLSRLNELKLVQEVDREKGELIMFNQALIDSAIGIIRQLIANQIPWSDIWGQIKEAASRGDVIARRITNLQLMKNQFKMLIQDPYDVDVESESSGPAPKRDIEVEIDLDLSAYANASKFFDLKKASAKKEERTLESQEKAFKSTEKKTLSTLREVATIQSIKKMRKIFWFEKFHWFISSENFLVLGGHDAQQNELLVKRYSSPHDVYLHADCHGAPTIIIKNPGKLESLSPKTLNEAGCLAVCASGSWESKIIATCWWVWGHQVSKSAPTGEYLPTGSFMIRGRKNYLPPCQLILGFGFLFRLTEASMVNHRGERSPKDYNNSEPSGDRNKPQPKLGEKEAEDVEPTSDHDSDSDDSESSDSSNSTLDEFPDTQLPTQLLDGGDGSGSNARTRTLSSVSSEFSKSTSTSDFGVIGGEAENFVIVQSGVLPQFNSDITKIGKKKQADKRKGVGPGNKPGKDVQKGQGQVPAPNVKVPGQGASAKANPSSQTSQSQQKPTENPDFSKPKRGQHGRQKKLKEKYKFQDDDERELRMQLLQSKGKSSKSTQPQSTPPKAEPAPPTPAAKNRNPLKSEPNDDPVEPKEKETGTEDSNITSKAGPAQQTESSSSSSKVEVQDQIVQQEEQLESLEIDVLDSLTGSPLENDELLFAIPVIGPYSALQNYKFRLKLIPGSTKRGKAAKNAIEAFSRDKLGRQREKDLIKSVKDQDLARNFPGKVKLAGGAADKKK